MSISSTTPNDPPSADQLAAARTRQWHQGGEALLTFENLRSWINATGLVLFTARPGQLPAPAPSFVEAVLGAPNANPILADTEQAKSLLARLIAEGIAVPLNLMGTSGETPDFVVSAPVFSYVFTLRGDKAWKQPPATSGAMKVSPLALAAYTMLTERATLSAYDLATQLGKEVTESAVLRALNELWGHLRVLPVPQPDGAATLWELTSARFTKLIKAGANAGQPSALSALISLYLNTAIVATEDEIETFLSPLAARSRIRDVVHALMAARQLETLAVEGKTILHVAGELPGFLAPAGSILIDAAEAEATPSLEGEEGTEPAEGAPRITKFVAKPRKVGTGFVSKPAGKPAFGKRAAPMAGDRQDRERRPFDRTGGPAKPSFTKPWQEGRPAPRGRGESAPGRGFSAATSRPGQGGDRPAYSRKAEFSGASGEDRPPRRPFTPRVEAGAEGRDAGPARKPFSKPGFAGKPAFGSRPGEGRPPRREFPARANAAGEGDARPPRRQFSPRPGGQGGPRGGSSERPPFGGPRKPGSFSARPQGDRPDRKPFSPRGGGAPRPGARPNGFGEGSSPDRRSRTAGPPFRKFDAPRGERPDRSSSGERPERSSLGAVRPPRPTGGGGFAGKPSGGFAAKRPGAKFAGKAGGSSFAGKPASGKPAGTFDKFKNNAKPFGNRPPSRKFRPEEGEPTA